MTKHALVVEVAESFGLTLKSATEVVELVFARIAEAVGRGERFHYPGFGAFSRRYRKARRIRDLKTGEPMRLPPTATLGFRASKHQRKNLKPSHGPHTHASTSTSL